METFPAFFPLRGKCVVIAGEGEPADAKARLFDGSPAVVRRLNEREALEPSFYSGADLIFIASWDAAFRQAAAGVARSVGAPLNVVDAPELSDFHTPAILDRGQVVAAIGTAGASPLLASLLRSELETLVPESAGQIAALFGERREAVRAAFPDMALRRAFLRRVLNGPAAGAAARGDMAGAAAYLDQALASGVSSEGRIVFIEVASSPDLMTLRAARVLAIADDVFCSRTADAVLANHGRREAERLPLDAATPARLRTMADRGRIIAVLDGTINAPLVEALRAQGIPVEILRSAAES